MTLALIWQAANNDWEVQCPSKVLATCRKLIVGWQATQKCSFEDIIKKMDFFFTTFYLVPEGSQKQLLDTK